MSCAGEIQNISFEDLQNKHDAIFLAVGLGATNRLNILDENLEGVIDALDFIERIKTRDWKSFRSAKPSRSSAREIRRLTP